MIFAVVDPSVFVSALIGRADAAPAQLVRAMAQARFTPIISPLLVEELKEVLERPKFSRWAGDGRGKAFLAAIVTCAAMHADDLQAPAAGLRDAEDEYLVKLARSRAADALVSVDRDLLDASIGDVRVVTPRAFLTDLASSSS